MGAYNHLRTENQHTALAESSWGIGGITLTCGLLVKSEEKMSNLN
jgi:hypothetical protein